MSNKATDSTVEEITISNNNIHILYITLGIVVLLILAWIVIIYLTQEIPMMILGIMTNNDLQIMPISDTT